MIHEDQRGHRFDHWDGTRQHARIVTAPARERRIVKRFIHRVLFVHDAVATGLKAAVEENVPPFEMPPWMPPERFVVVKTFSGADAKRVVSGKLAIKQNTAETGTDLKSL